MASRLCYLVAFAPWSPVLVLAGALSLQRCCCLARCAVAVTPTLSFEPYFLDPICESFLETPASKGSTVLDSEDVFHLRKVKFTGSVLLPLGA